MGRGVTGLRTAHRDPIPVMFVEDQPTIRAGLALLIDNTPGLCCAGCFPSMEQALPRAEADPPDVLLVDLGLPGMSGTEGIRVLHERNPELPVLVLTVFDDDERIFGAILAGACGYVLKTAPPDILLDRVRAVAEGQAPMTPEVARRVLETWRGRDLLDLEEERTLEKLAEGHVFRTAAELLQVPVREIGRRMRRVYDKLHHQP